MDAIMWVTLVLVASIAAVGGVGVGALCAAARCADCQAARWGEPAERVPAPPRPMPAAQEDRDRKRSWAPDGAQDRMDREAEELRRFEEARKAEAREDMRRHVQAMVRARRETATDREAAPVGPELAREEREALGTPSRKPAGFGRVIEFKARGEGEGER